MIRKYCQNSRTIRILKFSILLFGGHDSLSLKGDTNYMKNFNELFSVNWLKCINIKSVI